MRPRCIEPSRGELRKILNDHGTHLTWARVHPKSRRKVGQAAGYPDGNGYSRIGINGEVFMLHRIIWVLRNGAIPEGMNIDHIDGNTGNDRPENHRLATRSQNMHNRVAASNNTSGHKNVSWSKVHRKWEVRIRVNGKAFVKYSDSLERAAEIAIQMRRELQGDYAVERCRDECL